MRGWLGHVSLDTTNVYAEVDFETKAKALEKCEAPSLGKIPKRWRDQPARWTSCGPCNPLCYVASSPACRLWPAVADATSLPKPYYAPMCSRTFGAGNPPARICEGESRMAELLDHDRIFSESD